MKRGDREQVSFVDKMRKFAHAGISESAVPNRTANSLDEVDSLDERVRLILGIVNDKNRPVSNMLFFVMYDIESNKVRYQIVKYLQKRGCSRIQRSIFLGNLPVEDYESIRSDLSEVQAAYDNNDSILVVPISDDLLRSMKIIGQKIELDVIMHNRNTLFF